MFSPEQQLLVEKELVDGFVPKNGRAEDVAVAVQIMALVVERREQLFPDLRKIVVDYSCSVDDGRLTLDVRSAPISPIPDPA